MAHPDDIEFACSGTLAIWAQSGSRICYLVCTSGVASLDSSDMNR
ncbi:MAG: PIG-L family deacetylase, partial [Chloroflexota bacterium]|nr:PIG-L family deacetylase [Chloroflexota bacterium]